MGQGPYDSNVYEPVHEDSRSIPILVPIGVSVIFLMGWLLFFLKPESAAQSAAEPTVLVTEIVAAAVVVTQAPAVVMTKKGVPIQAKMSHYWPPLGGTNCSNFVNGYCVSRTSSGNRWEDWVDRGLACPRQFAFGTLFVIDGRTWTCVDRGGAIVTLPDGTVWLDLLTERTPYPYGSIKTVEVIMP